MDKAHLIFDEKQAEREATGTRTRGEVIQFNQYREAIGSIQVEERLIRNGFVIYRIYDWVPPESGILAFGDMKGPGNNRQSGFVYLEGNDRDQLFRRISVGASNRGQYLNNRGYLATLGKSGYILYF